MAKVTKVIEEEDEPREKEVVREVREEPARSNVGWVIAVIILLIVLFLLFGRGLFGGTDGANTNVTTTPTYNSGQ